MSAFELEMAKFAEEEEAAANKAPSFAGGPSGGTAAAPKPAPAQQASPPTAVPGAAARRRAKAASPAPQGAGTELGGSTEQQELRERRFAARRVAPAPTPSPAPARAAPSAVPAGGPAALAGDDDEDVRATGAIVGTCEEMCPRKQRERREQDLEIHSLERVPGADPPRTTPELCVKVFQRNLFDVTPDEFRTPRALAMTVGYLWNMLDRKDFGFQVVYEFLWDRLRSVRQDLTVQGMQGSFTTTLYEQMIRFHLIGQHELCAEKQTATNPDGFSSHLNIEQMNKALVSLRNQYQASYKRGEPEPNEPEFQAYMLLLQLDRFGRYQSDEGMYKGTLRGLRPDVLRSPPVQFAIKVHNTYKSGNYAGFFRLAAQAPYVTACLLSVFFTSARRKYLRLLNATVVKGAAQAIPMAELARVLHMESAEEAEALVTYHGLGVSYEGDGSAALAIRKSQYIEPAEDFPEHPEALVHARRAHELLRDEVIGASGRVADPSSVRFDGSDSAAQQPVDPAAAVAAAAAASAKAKAAEQERVEKARAEAERRAAEQAAAQAAAAERERAESEERARRAEEAERVRREAAAVKEKMERERAAIAELERKREAARLAKAEAAARAEAEAAAAAAAAAAKAEAEARAAAEAREAAERARKAAEEEAERNRLAQEAARAAEAERRRQAEAERQRRLAEEAERRRRAEEEARAAAERRRRLAALLRRITLRRAREAASIWRVNARASRERRRREEAIQAALASCAAAPSCILPEPVVSTGLPPDTRAAAAQFRALHAATPTADPVDVAAIVGDGPPAKLLISTGALASKQLPPRAAARAEWLRAALGPGAAPGAGLLASGASFCLRDVGDAEPQDHGDLAGASGLVFVQLPGEAADDESERAATLSAAAGVSVPLLVVGNEEGAPPPRGSWCAIRVVHCDASRPSRAASELADGLRWLVSQAPKAPPLCRVPLRELVEEHGAMHAAALIRHAVEAAPAGWPAAEFAATTTTGAYAALPPASWREHASVLAARVEALHAGGLTYARLDELDDDPSAVAFVLADEVEGAVLRDAPAAAALTAAFAARTATALQSVPAQQPAPTASKRKRAAVEDAGEELAARRRAATPFAALNLAVAEERSRLHTMASLLRTPTPSPGELAELPVTGTEAATDRRPGSWAERLGVAIRKEEAAAKRLLRALRLAS